MPIKVEVGNSEECEYFYVHPGLLQGSSAFFQTALKEEWMEGQQRTVKLPEQTPPAFSKYVQWLYTGKIFSKDDKHNFVRSYVFLAKLYVLGEALLDTVFRDRIIDVIVTCARESISGGNGKWPTRKTVDTIYNGTPNGSPARHLMVSMHVLKGTESWVDEDAESCDHEFAVELARALLKDRKPTVDSDKKYKEILQGVPCSYHGHGADETCEAKKASTSLPTQQFSVRW